MGIAYLLLFLLRYHLLLFRRRGRLGFLLLLRGRRCGLGRRRRGGLLLGRRGGRLLNLSLHLLSLSLNVSLLLLLLNLNLSLLLHRLRRNNAF